MGTFGLSERFTHAHSYIKNNPILTGRSKKYETSRNNKDHFDELKILKKSKTFSNLNILKNRERNKNNFSTRRNKLYNLSKINNKSSDCITPHWFNPLINYKEKNTKKNSNKINNKKNKDHFYHMNIKELFEYKFQIKRKKINYNFISQIIGLPGSKNNNDIFKIKKTGKKQFHFIYKNKESTENKSRNSFYKNKFRYSYNTTNNFMKKINNRIYEYDEPMISYKNIN